MNSSRTNQLYEMYVKSLNEDFKKWLVKEVEEEVQKYITPKIRFVSFDVEQEYDDNDYYDAITSINFSDANGHYISLDDDSILKPEYQDEDGDRANGAPDFDDLRYNTNLGSIMDELKILGLDSVRIDLEEIKEAIKNV